jgi:hypothetical protein
MHAAADSAGRVLYSVQQLLQFLYPAAETRCSNAKSWLATILGVSVTSCRTCTLCVLLLQQAVSTACAG